MSEAQNRRQLLATERALLRVRSGLLRDQLAAEAEGWKNPLAMADRVVDGARWLRQHPEVPVGVVAVLAVTRPRVLLRWAGRGVWAWQLWRRAKPHVRSLQHWWDLPRRF
jgi:hypothetical protein